MMSSTFRKMREEAGYSVDQVAKKLNIRKQYIVCLEEGDLDALPGKVYVDGYTKMYSKFLGIEIPETPTLKTKQPIKTKTNKWKKIKRKYIVLFSSVMLILVVLVYSMIKSPRIDAIENSLIQNIQQKYENNKEEFN